MLYESIFLNYCQYLLISFKFKFKEAEAFFCIQGKKTFITYFFKTSGKLLISFFDNLIFILDFTDVQKNIKEQYKINITNNYQITN